MYLAHIKEIIISSQFVSLIWSLRAETRLGPDGTRLEQLMLKPGNTSQYKHAGWVVFENKEEETDLKSSDKGKEDHNHSQQIKLNNFTVSL